MKRPASQYYWGDWRRDTALQSCSIAARGLWHEMNCLMHDCEPYGHLCVAGQPMAVTQLARLVGISPKETEKLLAELREAAIFSETENGVIYSRRMVRDEQIRNARASGGYLGAEYGKKGGDQGYKGGRPRKDNGGLKTPLTPHENPPPASASASASATAFDLSPDGDMSGKPDGAPVRKSNGNTHHRSDAIAVLQFLNEKAGRAYQPTEPNLKLIVGRLKEGATVQQCRQVIAKKTREWSIKPDMAEYLRPATLFNATKFAQYVGELVPAAAHDERGGMFDGLS